MAKTFVVSGVNYANSAFDVVSLSGSVPCTAIELSESTATVSNLVDGSITLTATTTPANTTDSISWQSSDETIVAVSGGTLTAIAPGTVTITVTCGSCSATCEVTSRIFLVDNIAKVAGLWAGCDSYYKSGGSGLPYTDPSASRALIVSTAGTLKIYGADYYPIPIPSSAVKIRVDVGSSGLSSDGLMACSSKQAVSGQPTIALAIERVTASVSGTILDYVVPQEEGSIPNVDCAVIVLIDPNYGTVTEEMVSQVTVEFLAE